MRARRDACMPCFHSGAACQASLRHEAMLAAAPWCWHVGHEIQHRHWNNQQNASTDLRPPCTAPRSPDWALRCSSGIAALDRVEYEGVDWRTLRSRRRRATAAAIERCAGAGVGLLAACTCWQARPATCGAPTPALLPLLSSKYFQDMHHPPAPHPCPPAGLPCRPSRCWPHARQPPRC